MVDETTLTQLNHQTQLTNFLAGEISSCAYLVGAAMSFGINWATPNSWFECMLFALLSWVNVGYMLAHKLA